MITSAQIAALIILLNAFGVSSTTLDVVQQNLQAQRYPTALYAGLPDPAPQFTEAPNPWTDASRTYVTMNWASDIPASATLSIDTVPYYDWTTAPVVQTWNQATSFSYHAQTPMGQHYFAVILTADGRTAEYNGVLPGWELPQ